MLHPIFNSLTREPIFFPHLMQLHMSFDGAGTLSDPVLAQAIQDLVALRGKRITHLTTPAYQDVKVMQFLRDQVPYIKVCQPPPIRVLMTAYPVVGAPYPWSVIQRGCAE